MSMIDDLPPTFQAMQRIWRGQFAQFPILTDVTMLASVFLPDFDKSFLFQNVRWSPRCFPAPAEDTNGTPFEGKHLAYYLFPSPLDPCLCIFDNNRDLWVIEWWPYGGQHTAF
jgi:hypothetical protein